MMVEDVITVLSLDPGKTTGHAVGDIENGTMKIRAGQHEFDHIDLYSQLIMLNPKYVVCESFEFRNRSRKGLVLFSLELIGVVHLWAQQNKRSLFMQTAGQGKGYYTDQKLKDDLLWIPGKPHAMDAIRHLLHWYTFGYGFQYNVQGYDRA